MKKLIVFLLLIISCEATQTRITGQKGERIISLSPHITEILYALGKGKQIVAVTDYCVFPDSAKLKTRVGGLLNPNLEKITALAPTMIIGTSASRDLREKINLKNCAFVFLPNDEINDLWRTIDTLGTLLSCRPRAEELLQSLRDSLIRYQQLAQQLSSKNPTAMLVIGRAAPQIKDVMVAGGRTFISQVWELTGGKNAFFDLPVRYAAVNPEAIEKRSPEVIVEFKYQQQWDENKQRKNQAQWQVLNSVKAVERDNIFVLTGDYTLIPGPRLYLLARDFYRIRLRMERSYE